LRLLFYSGRVPNFTHSLHRPARPSTVENSSPTDPNNIAGFTAQDGAGTEGEVGKGSEWIAADCDSEDNAPGSREAHHVGSSAEKDCGVPARTLAEDQGAAEEGCIGARPGLASGLFDFLRSLSLLCLLKDSV
jgi:hypothetical protein